MNTATQTDTARVTDAMRSFATKLVAYVAKTHSDEATIEEGTRGIEVRWPGCCAEIHRHFGPDGTTESSWVRIFSSDRRGDEYSIHGNKDTPAKVPAVGKRVVELLRRFKERRAQHEARRAGRQRVRELAGALLPKSAAVRTDGYYEFGLPTKHGTIHLKAENSGKATVCINLHATLEPEDAARLMLALQAAIGEKP